MADEVRYERVGAAALLTIDREQRRNAVDGATADALQHGYERFSPTTEGSTLGFPERRWGVPLTDGGTQRLPRIVGVGRALDLILTGRMVQAPDALAMGLLTEVVPAGRHLERALEIAEGLAAFPQETMLADRRSIYEGLGRDLPAGLSLEAHSGYETLEVARRGAARFAGGEGRGGAGAGV